jgi:hypothetical protein
MRIRILTTKINADPDPQHWKKHVKRFRYLPIIGFFQSWATVRATTATLASGAPIPGPCIKKFKR